MRIVAEAIRQVLEGSDFPAAKSLLSGITPEKAAYLPPGFKYSVATLVLHADFWQRIWFGKLNGEKSSSFTDDWRVPAADEWPKIRKEFLDRFAEIYAFACNNSLNHHAKSDVDAEKLLLRIAVHNSYHMGQIVLLKRAVRGLK